MTKEDKYLRGCLFAINQLREKGSSDFAVKVDGKWETTPWSEICEWIIKALEQQPCDDIMAIHTQGLDEGIRCAMCTNSMKSDRGCDGGCVVNEDMYKKVMDTIKNQMFSRPTSDDCVSRKAVLNTLFYKSDNNCEVVLNKELQDRIKALPPVTPTRCIAEIKFSKDDLREICNERIEVECTHGTCKDCKHNRPNSYARTMFSCERGNRFKLRDCENFYCADFEKRGNDNDTKTSNKGI